MPWSSHTGRRPPRPGFLAAAKTALGFQPDALFTSFFTEDDVLGLP